MFPPRRLHHLSEVCNHFGLSAGLLRVADRVLQGMGCEVHKVLRNPNQTPVDEPLPDPRISLRRLTAEEVATYSSDLENRIPASFVARVLSGQQFCFGTFWESRLAAHSWFALESIDPEQNAGVTMSYPSDTACAFRGFTHPDFRGLHLHAAVRQRLLSALQEHGIRNLVCLVSWTNWPSRRYCYRVGYRDLGHLITFGPRHRRRWLGPRQASAYGIRFGASERDEPPERSHHFCAAGSALSTAAVDGCSASSENSSGPNIRSR